MNTIDRWPSTKRDAKRLACRIVALLIENYFGVGQPETSAYEDGLADNDPRVLRLQAAFVALQEEMERRSSPA